MSRNAKHLFLIGYRGSGKSTVGRLLADRIGWSFVDTDDMVERASSISIKEIFEREGEDSFRRLEESAVASAAARELPTVISLGGGAILRRTNRLQIQDHGSCVWLKGSAQALFRRISADASSEDRRPDLSHCGGYDEVVELLAKREPTYELLANLTVETDGKTPDEIVLEISDWRKMSD